MSELTPELLDAMKADLLAKRASLTHTVTTELAGMSNQAHHADLAEGGGDANEEERSFGLLEMGSAELKQIDAALDQIKRGRYGLCSTCEKAINIERLKALPFATLCIDCKRDEESSESVGLD